MNAIEGESPALGVSNSEKRPASAQEEREGQGLILPYCDGQRETCNEGDEHTMRVHDPTS